MPSGSPKSESPQLEVGRSSADATAPVTPLQHIINNSPGIINNSSSHKTMMYSSVARKTSGSLTSSLSLDYSMDSFGSVGSLDSGHSSELGHAHSPSTPRSQTPTSSTTSSSCYPRDTALQTMSCDVGTPPTLASNGNAPPPNFFDDFQHSEYATDGTCTPVALDGSSDEDDLKSDVYVRRSSSRDSGHSPTVLRSDSMGSNTSRNSDTSTISAMSGLSRLSGVSAQSSYSGNSNTSYVSGLSRNSQLSSLSTLSRKSGVSSVSGVSELSAASGVSRLSDISGLSTNTTTSGRTIQPRKSREELEASIEQLESLWSADDDWIMIFDKLINNSLMSRPRRHTHATSNHFAPYRSPLRSSLRGTSKSVSLTSSPYHTRYFTGQSVVITFITKLDL